MHYSVDHNNIHHLDNKRIHVMTTVLSNCQSYIRRAQSSAPACNRALLSNHGNRPSPATGCRFSQGGSTYPRTTRSSATSCISHCSSLRNVGSAFRMSGMWHHTPLQPSEETHVEKFTWNLSALFTAHFFIGFNGHRRKAPGWEMVNINERQQSGEKFLNYAR